jgi:hypothetical protein
MEQNLKIAKSSIALNKKDTVVEKVLAEIILLSSTDSQLSTYKLTHTIPEKIHISPNMYRKCIHNLYKMGAIKKVGITVFLNSKFFNI